MISRIRCFADARRTRAEIGRRYNRSPAKTIVGGRPPKHPHTHKHALPTLTHANASNAFNNQNLAPSEHPKDATKPSGFSLLDLPRTANGTQRQEARARSRSNHQNVQVGRAPLRPHGCAACEKARRPRPSNEVTKINARRRTETLSGAPSPKYDSEEPSKKVGASQQKVKAVKRNWNNQMGLEPSNSKQNQKGARGSRTAVACSRRDAPRLGRLVEVRAGYLRRAKRAPAKQRRSCSGGRATARILVGSKCGKERRSCAG